MPFSLLFSPLSHVFMPILPLLPLPVEDDTATMPPRPFFTLRTHYHCLSRLIYHAIYAILVISPPYPTSLSLSYPQKGAGSCHASYSMAHDMMDEEDEDDGDGWLDGKKQSKRRCAERDEGVMPAGRWGWWQVWWVVEIVPRTKGRKAVWHAAWCCCCHAPARPPAPPPLPASSSPPPLTTITITTPPHTHITQVTRPLSLTHRTGHHSQIMDLITSHSLPGSLPQGCNIPCPHYQGLLLPCHCHPPSLSLITFFHHHCLQPTAHSAPSGFNRSGECSFPVLESELGVLLPCSLRRGCRFQ